MTPYFRIFLGLLLVLGFLAWGISEAQTTICRSTGYGYTTCTTLPGPPANNVPSPPPTQLDPSVISSIPDGVRVDPALLQLLLLQQCIQREIKKGYPYYTARQRCFQ